MARRPEVAGRGGTLQPTQAVGGGWPRQPGLLFAQLAQRLGERVAALRIVVAQIVEPAVLALDLVVHELARVVQAEGGVQAAPGLGDAPAGVVVGAAQQQAGRPWRPVRNSRPMPRSPRWPSRPASRVTLPRRMTRVMGASGTVAVRWPFS